MRNRNNANFIGRNLIEDGVRKPTKKIPPPSSTEDDANIRIGQDVANGSIKLGDECDAKFGIRVCFIKCSCIFQLAESERKNYQIHFNAARTLASASVIGMT